MKHDDVRFFAHPLDGTPLLDIPEHRDLVRRDLEQWSGKLDPCAPPKATYGWLKPPV